MDGASWGWNPRRTLNPPTGIIALLISRAMRFCWQPMIVPQTGAFMAVFQNCLDRNMIDLNFVEVTALIHAPHFLSRTLITDPRPVFLCFFLVVDICHLMIEFVGREWQSNFPSCQLSLLSATTSFAVRSPWIPDRSNLFANLWATLYGRIFQSQV